MTITKTEQIALDRALALLRAAKAQYKIILPDGTEYGELVVAKAKDKRNSRYPRGALSAYFRPLLEDVKPGEVRVLPAGTFDCTVLRAALSGWCTTKWGKGNAITSVDIEARAVEVMRVA